MTALRRNLCPVIVALFAALAVLFVSTASLACDAPVNHDAAVMMMDAESVPCEQQAEKVACQKACLVFCQSLIPQSGSSTPARIYAAVLYPSAVAQRTDFVLEAEDPPPRP